MKKSKNRLFAVMLIGFVASVVGCKDSSTTTPIQADAFLEGTVRDAAGNPVEGVAVTLEYALAGYDVIDPLNSKQLPKIQDLPDRFYRYSILDLERRLVRLVYDSNADPPGSLRWDFKDEQGRSVPAGVYYARAEFGGDVPPMETKTLLLLPPNDLELQYERTNAITDEQGLYRIRLALVPVGEPIDLTDSSGEELGTYPVSHEVTVIALRREETSITHSSVLVTIVNRTSPLRLDLQLP